MTESKGKITFLHEENDPIEKYIGKTLGMIMQHFPQGTWDSVGKDIPPERIEELKKRFEDVEWQGDIEVHLNHTPIVEQLKRLFAEDRKLSLFTRVLLGLPTTLWYGALGKLAHWNFYNPYSETLQLFNENEYIDMSKLTLAELIDKEGGSTKAELMAFANTIPFVLNTVLNTYVAGETMKKLSEDEKIKARDYLASSVANDAVADALQIAGVGAIAGMSPLGVIASGLTGLGVSLGVQEANRIFQKFNANPEKLFGKEKIEDAIKEMKKEMELEDQRSKDMGVDQKLLSYAS